MPVAEVVHLVRAKVHPEACADDRFPVDSPWCPCQAQPWREVRADWRIQRRALRAKASAGELYNGKAVSNLVQDRVIFVPQSYIEGEIGPGLERILHIRHIVRASISTEGQLTHETVVTKDVVNEILRAIVCKCPRSDPFRRIVKSMALDPYPHPDRVPSPNNAQIVVPVNSSADLGVE